MKKLSDLHDRLKDGTLAAVAGGAKQIREWLEGGYFAHDCSRAVLDELRGFKELLERLADPKPFVLQCTAYSPYDGCFHEPNFFFFQRDNVNEEEVKVDGLYVSQKHLCDVLSHDCLPLGKFWERLLCMDGYHHAGMDDFEVIEVEDLAESTHVNWWSIFSRRSENAGERGCEYTIDNFQFVWECPVCHQKITYGVAMVDDGYNCGNGGIGVISNRVVCEECYDLGTCDDCGDYAGTDNPDPEDNVIVVTDEMAKESGQYCRFCAEKKFAEPCSIHSEECRKGGKILPWESIHGACPECAEHVLTTVAKTGKFLKDPDKDVRVCTNCGKEYLFLQETSNALGNCPVCYYELMRPKEL